MIHNNLMDKSTIHPTWNTVDVFLANDDYSGLCHYLADLLRPIVPNVSGSLRELAASYATRAIEDGKPIHRDQSVLCTVPIDMMARLREVDSANPTIEAQVPGGLVYRYVDGDPAIVNLNLDIQGLVEYQFRIRAEENAKQKAANSARKREELEKVVKRLKSFIYDAGYDVDWMDYAKKVHSEELQLADAISQIKNDLREIDLRRAVAEYERNIPLVRPGVPRKAVTSKQSKVLKTIGDETWWTNQGLILKIPTGAKVPAYMAGTPGYDPDVVGVFNRYLSKGSEVLSFAGRGTKSMDYYVLHSEVVGVDRHALALVRKFYPKGCMELHGSSNFAFVLCGGEKVALIVVQKLNMGDFPTPEWDVVFSRWKTQNEGQGG